MTRTTAPYQARGVSRLGTAAAWISAACCLPYLVLKVVWTLGMPVGITDRSELDAGGWVAGNAVMAVIQLAGLLLALALTRPWARRLPAWLVLLPAWVGIGILFQVALGAVLLGVFSPLSQGSSLSTGAYQPWVFVMVYAAFVVQGVALAIAFACHVQARWGRVLSEPTGEVIARRTAAMRSWPESHLAELAQAVAAMAVALVVVFGYWAAGGSFGLANVESELPWSVQAARVGGAVIAVAGLWGLAGRWGRRTRFWLPVALTWVGSGALVGFDGLTLVLNQLSFLFGTGTTGPGWTVTDTVVVVKVVIGMLAAAVGVLALKAATEYDEESART